MKIDYQPVNGVYTVPELPGIGNEWSEQAMEEALQKQSFQFTGSSRSL